MSKMKEERLKEEQRLAKVAPELLEALRATVKSLAAIYVVLEHWGLTGAKAEGRRGEARFLAALNEGRKAIRQADDA